MPAIEQIRSVRERLHRDGPPWSRAEGDFAKVTMPRRDCDLIRDLLVAERATTVVEIGLAYASSALAIGEALAGRDNPRQLIVDPFQDSAFNDTGWNLLRDAGLDATTELMREWSSTALPRLVADGFTADAAFVDGSHRFHEVFVDLYFLRKLVRPGGVVILDDHWAPSVRTAAAYYEQNLGWEPVPFEGGSRQHIGSGKRRRREASAACGQASGIASGASPKQSHPDAELVARCAAYRVPELFEPDFEDFTLFFTKPA